MAASRNQPWGAHKCITHRYPGSLHPSEIVEFTPQGEFVREYNVDPSQGGAFGLDTVREGPFNYAVIDDVTNSLSVYRLEDR